MANVSFALVLNVHQPAWNLEDLLCPGWCRYLSASSYRTGLTSNLAYHPIINYRFFNNFL